MIQCFYIISYYDSETGNRSIEKVFLQEHEAIKWGRRLATQYKEFEVYLSKQEITRTATVQYVKNLTPFKQ